MHFKPEHICSPEHTWIFRMWQIVGKCVLGNKHNHKEITVGKMFENTVQNVENHIVI